MQFLKKIRKIVYQLDLFCSSQLLRYNKDTEYKTLTGGLLSLMIVVFILTGFMSMISDTLNRSSITSNLITVKQSDPPLATLTPNKENMFMFAIQIQSLDLTYIANLSQTPRYFEIQANILQQVNGVPNLTPVSMEQCTYQHWSMMPEFVEHFDVFAISSWLCVPLNMPIPIQGSYMSPISYLYQINVFPCKNQTSNDTCASQEEISNLFTAYGNFYMTVNYINPVINPNEQEYISYYIQGNDYVIFSETIASQAWFYFSDFTITTDNSIWPYSEMSVETGCIVEQKAINHPYAVTENVPTVSVYLAKSENSLMYNRQVQKISAVFSYIGGLVGAITAFLFLIKIYTDTSLQITIGLNLFEQSEAESLAGKSPMGEKGFNFLDFIRLTLYRFLKLVRWKGSSCYSERLEKYQNEAVRQLDVQLLLKRLIKLQSCMTRLFSREQLQEMKEMESITVESAQKMRLLLLKPSSLGDEPNGNKVAVQQQTKIKEKDNNISPPNLDSGISGFDSGILFNKNQDILDNKQMEGQSRYQLKKPPVSFDYYQSEIEHIQAREEEDEIQINEKHKSTAKLRRVKQSHKKMSTTLEIFPRSEVPQA